MVENYLENPQNELMEKISEVVKRVRGDDDKEYLLGWCHENSVALALELYEEDIPVDIIWGAYYRGEEPESVEEAEKLGNVHLWCEVPYDDKYIVEIATICDEDYGDPVLYTELPAKYIRLPKSRIEFDKEITADDLLPGKHPDLFESHGVPKY